MERFSAPKKFAEAAGRQDTNLGELPPPFWKRADSAGLKLLFLILYILRHYST